MINFIKNIIESKLASQKEISEAIGLTAPEFSRLLRKEEIKEEKADFYSPAIKNLLIDKKNKAVVLINTPNTRKEALSFICKSLGKGGLFYAVLDDYKDFHVEVDGGFELHLFKGYITLNREGNKLRTFSYDEIWLIAEFINNYSPVEG